MIHYCHQFGQSLTLKKSCIKHHGEAHFEDTLKGDFFNYLPKKGLCLYLKTSIRRGLHPFHYGPGGAYGRFDL
jgi:hypothetical protein